MTTPAIRPVVRRDYPSDTPEIAMGVVDLRTICNSQRRQHDDRRSHMSARQRAFPLLSHTSERTVKLSPSSPQVWLCSVGVNEGSPQECRPFDQAEHAYLSLSEFPIGFRNECKRCVNCCVLCVFIMNCCVRRIALIECFEKALALVRSVVLLSPCPRGLSASARKHCAYVRTIAWRGSAVAAAAAVVAGSTCSCPEWFDDTAEGGFLFQAGTVCCHLGTADSHRLYFRCLMGAAAYAHGREWPVEGDNSRHEYDCRVWCSVGR